MSRTTQVALINVTKWNGSFPDTAGEIDSLLGAVDTQLDTVADLTADSLTYHYRTTPAGVIDGSITINNFGSDDAPLVDFNWGGIETALDLEGSLSYTSPVISYYDRDDETAIT